MARRRTHDWDFHQPTFPHSLPAVTEFLQQLLNGLSLGAIYALIALGYTMVYGVLRFINFAHADVFMVGAMIGLGLGQHLPEGTLWGGLLVLIAAMAGCALLGMRIERLAYRPFREQTDINLIQILGSLAVGLSVGWIGLTSSGKANRLGLLIMVWIGAETGAMLIKLSGIRWVIRQTSGHASKLNVLITAIGVSLLLESVLQHPAVFGATPRAFPAVFPVKNFAFAGLALSSSQLAVILVAAALMLALQWVVHRTRLGTAMRAVALNPQAAQLVGVNTGTVISFTFALGSALAGAGGVLYALNYPTVDPLMGVMPGLKAFVAAVLGGIGNIPGAMLGGVLIGLMETWLGATSYSTYRDAVAFAVLILILLVKPTGIMGSAATEKV
jgi:branched-chain amino acid transport system permease protein